MDSLKLVQIENKYGAHNYEALDVVLACGKGIWVYDVEGRRYLDFLSAYSALNQGHCHPRLVAVIKDQVEKLTLTSRAFRNDQLPLFCKELCELTGFDLVLPMNSGAEAVETAIKAARKWGYVKKGIPKDNAEIIVCANNFHGRTISVISFSSEEQYKADFGPLTPGFMIIPYGNVMALEQAITENTAAFFVEPIQGEGGVNIPPDGFLKESAEICRRHNVLFMLDEIQTGLGRTGKLFAYQHENASPDVITIGKALSGGFYPVSAVLSTSDVLGVFKPGDHGSTFGGNPLACAIAREALKIIQDEKLAENSAQMGSYLIDKLRTIKSRHIKEIRGRGLFIGVELKEEAGGARKFCVALKEEGLLCKETHENVIRFAPPLIITKNDLDWAFTKIVKVLQD